ncbi:hypothetical protein G6F66_014942 [Rhizopus arrhizus]|nr:hypothetical protein G6F66_014942 [Rhizopus arrhizus]
MGVGERGRGNQQAAGAWRDLAALEQELGFAFLEVIVEVQRPQHVPVQGLGLGILRVQLAVPVRIAALARRVPLQVDRAWAQAGAGQVGQLLLRHVGEVLGRQASRLAIAVLDLQHQRSDQRLWITA